jgi:hypothetical protein
MMPGARFFFYSTSRPLLPDGRGQSHVQSVTEGRCSLHLPQQPWTLTRMPTRSDHPMMGIVIRGDPRAYRTFGYAGCWI